MEQKYTKELLESLVKESISYSQVVKKLGFTKTGGSPHRWIRKLIKRYDIDISHFKGQSWAKGLKGHSHPGIRTLSYKEVFKKNSKVVGTKLRRHYIQKHPEYKCAVCNLEEWLGEKITLHLDHINSVNNDNRESNLRWICPNCHQQTNTWGWTKEKMVQLNIKNGIHKNVCIKIQAIRQTKIKWPSVEILIERINKSNFVEVGLELGVSDNSIRKHLIKNNINPKDIRSIKDNGKKISI